MPPRKPKRRKIAPSENNSEKQFLIAIRSDMRGHKKEAFVRRIITKLSINPNLSNLWFSLGLLLSEAEEYELANEAFERVVKLNPDHRKLWNSKAIVLRHLGRHEEAGDCYKKSLASFTGQIDGYNNLQELQDEIKERRHQLGLEDFDDESIEYLTNNILDLDSFISELESLAESEEDAKTQATADNFSEKLDELESISRPKMKVLSNLFRTKKDEKRDA